MECMPLAQLGERALVNLLRVAPLRAYSRLIRVLSQTPVPRSLRGPVLGHLALRLGMDLSEAELELTEYSSLHALFVRRLQPGLRHLSSLRGNRHRSLLRSRSNLLRRSSRLNRCRSLFGLQGRGMLLCSEWIRSIPSDHCA